MTGALVVLGLLAGGLVAAVAQALRDWGHPQRMQRAEKRSWQ